MFFTCVLVFGFLTWAVVATLVAADQCRRADELSRRIRDWSREGALRHDCR